MTASQLGTGLIYLFLLIFLGKDFYTWVIKDGEIRIMKEAREFNALPMDIAKLGILTSITFANIVINILFAGAYLSLRIPVASWLLAGVNLYYVLTYVESYPVLKLPTNFKSYKWLVIFEAFVGIPLLMYGLFMLT